MFSPHRPSIAGASAITTKVDVMASSSVSRVMFAFTLPPHTVCRFRAAQATVFAVTFGKSMSVCATLLT